jgi:hypothetical protein
MGDIPARWPGDPRSPGLGGERRGEGQIMWNPSSIVVPVLLVTGPAGVGKTVVLHEADAL